MAKIRPIKNHVIFQFVEEMVRHMGVAQFEQKTDWGFTFVRVDESTQSPRWGIVTHVGPETDEAIEVGMKVLIENLQWTNEFEVDGQKYWRTDSDHILAIDDDFTLPAEALK